MKLLAFARVAARQAFVNRAQLLARAVFLALLLVVFSQLWGVVFGSGAIDPALAVDYVWYLALTEWVTLAVPQLHLEVEAELRSGTLEYRMMRPASYLTALAGETIGAVAVRLAILAVAAIGCAWALTGSAPTHPSGLLLAAPLGVLAALVWIGLQLVIGLLVFWVRDASPIYLIVQKAMFVLGGLMLPLDIYPDWLREVALYTPFSAMIYGVGQMALSPSFDNFVLGLAKLALWGLLIWACVFALHRRAVRRMTCEGV